MEVSVGQIKRISPPIPPNHILAHEEYVLYHQRRFSVSVQMLLPILKPATEVLSVGIEPGYFEAFLASEYGCHMSGTELPKHHPAGYQYEVLLEDCRHDRRVTIPVTMSEAGKAPLPFPDSRFDLVLFLEVIEHLLCRPQPAISEIYRVLKPDGYLFLSTPNAQHWHRVAFILAGRRYPDTEFGDDPTHRHHQLFSMCELRELLKAAAFEIVRSQYEDCYGLGRGKPRGGFAKRLARLLALLPQFRKENIFILARRRRT